MSKSEMKRLAVQRDTPRTDAAIFPADVSVGKTDWVVLADFSRQLERENAALRMQLYASCNAEELRQVRAENAALLAENSKLRSALEIVHFKREPWQ